VRGKTAKRIRKLALRRLFLSHISSQVPVPSSPEEAEFQFKRMHRALKRLWKQGSNPRSLNWLDGKESLGVLKQSSLLSSSRSEEGIVESQKAEPCT